MPSPISLLVRILLIVVALAPPAIHGADNAGGEVKAGHMIETVGAWQYPQWSKEEAKQIISDGSFLRYTPVDWDGTKPLPVLIYLHTSSSKGTDINEVRSDEMVPRLIAEGRKIDALVLCPQIEGDWGGDQAAAFIEFVLTTVHGIDKDRVYLAGINTGAGGAWEAAKQCAGDLAAVIAVSTHIDSPARSENLMNLPVWAFHNVNDPYQKVEKTRSQVNAARSAGAKYIFYTEFTDRPGKESGGIWHKAHRDSWEMAFRDEAMWTWLFKQRRGKPELALPAPEPTARELIKGLPVY